MTDQSALGASANWLVGSGKAARLIRSMNWTNTPLGPIESWPQSLRTVVSLCLASNSPAAVVWGPHQTQIYNDGYRVICGAKHPAAMGQDFRACWGSAWPAIGKAFDQALRGKARHLENQRVFLGRNGYLEETFLTFSLNPIRDETGSVGGLFIQVTENSSQMVAARRACALHELAAHGSGAQSAGEVFALACEILANYEFDLPFTLFYELEEDSTQATLVGHTGLSPDLTVSPASIDLAAPAKTWPLADVLRSRTAIELDDLAQRFATPPCGPYPEPPTNAVLLPLVPPGSEQPTGICIIGLSPRLPVDADYRRFCEQIAVAVAANPANARAMPHTAPLRVPQAEVAGHSGKAFNKQNRLTRMRTVLTAADIQEEVEVNRSRSLLEQITATSPDILFIFDIIENRHVYCSARIHAVLGYTPEEFQSARIYRQGDFVHPDELPAMTQWIQGIASSDDKAIHEVDLRVLHAAGSYRWFHVRASVFSRLDDGNVKQIIGTGRDITDKKLAREALQLSEERHRFSLEAGAIGAWDMDLKTQLAWRSPTHDRIFGYESPLSEWTYEIFLDHVFHEDRAQVDQAFQHALTSSGLWKFECRIQRIDGALRWISTQGRVVRDPAGNPVRIYGTVSDITEQLNTKASLERQTSILQLILNSMSEGVIVCNAKGELILVNQSAEQLLKMDGTVSDLRDFAASYQWLMTDGVASCHYDRRPLVRALNGEKVNDFEVIIRSANQEVDLIVNSSAVPLRDRKGNIVGAVNVFRNVTESKRAKQDLRDAEQHFKLLVEGTTDYAIFMLDVQGNVVSWNPGAQRILGYQQSEVIGKHVSIFYTPEDIQKGEPQRKLNQTIEEGRAEEDNWRVRKDGRRFWSTGVLDALHDEHGRIRGFVKIMRDNTARRLAEENTYFLANHDPLTGLANRTRFLERLHEALINADRDDTQVAVLLLDLDRFKLINDTLGHHVGDVLLKKVAQRLSKCVRETDTVARLGGDEFVIILTRLKDLQSVEVLADKIVQEMALPYYINRQEIRSGTSLGVAVYRKDGNDAGDLLQKADLAMYRAKSSGRNHYRIFAQSMLTEVQTRKAQEDSLRHALEHQEFELAFQPQINLDTLGLSGAEVLLRSKNKVLQAIPTGKIIALAEETGLIIPLGEWILQTTCRQLKKWQKMGLPFFKVAVNFSPTHLLAPNFVNTIRKTLDETGLDPKYLEIEVTEGLLVAASEANNGVMTALKDLGVSISVDDFGTGFSALSYLKNFPVDVLKLDESLVRHLPRDQDDVAIVSAIIKLALDLNIQVVAEGVETIDQLAYLRTTDCNTAQGFLFSPAVRTEKFEDLLQARKWASPVLH